MAEPSGECVRRAQAGDPAAITELIQSQQHYVYSIAMSVLHQPEDAADLTQEAFVRLMRVLPQYNGESRFTTWLYRMVVNLGRDELRRRGRQVPVITPSETADEEGLDPLASVASEDRWGDPVRAYSDVELHGAVRRALDQLDPQYRTALTLFYFDDMKYTDIAEVLDLPLNTVKSHIRRGKERLAVPPNSYEEGTATKEPERKLSNAPVRPASFAVS